jgi:hypothetical protein
MMTDTSALEPAEYMRRLFDDVEFSYLVVMAAQLGVADLLASGARSIADLSAATGVDAQSLYRVLRALASRGLFREEGDKRFSLTPLADPLRQDAPHSIRPQALWRGSEAYRQASSTRCLKSAGTSGRSKSIRAMSGSMFPPVTGAPKSPAQLR